MGCWDSRSQASFGNRNICYNFLNDRFYTRFSILYNNNIFSIDYSIASGLGIACTNTQCAPAHFISTERAEAMYKCGRKQNLGELHSQICERQEARDEHSTHHGHESLSFLPCSREACCHSFSASAFVFE